MAVIDHPVHEKVKINESFRYGCHNRKEFMDAYYAPNRAAGTDGYKPTWWLERIRVPFVMSRDCRFDLSLTDAACEGCKHRGSGEAYVARVRAAASVK